MKTKTRVRSGGRRLNHNETLLCDSGTGLKVKTRVKAGGTRKNHNETLLRDRG
jgi:hypothetical protein